MEGRMFQRFIVPWMNPADVKQMSDWVNETVWYQISPDRFYNGTSEENMPDIVPWHAGPVTN